MKMLHKIAFYPCCGGDIEEPRELLKSFVDEIIFCDLKKFNKNREISSIEPIPKAKFWCGDVVDLIDHLPPICVLFYRRDSGGKLWHIIKSLRDRGLSTEGVTGEGGSGIPIMADLLPLILRKFDPRGGWIFSDGSNSDELFSSWINAPNEWMSNPNTCFKFMHVPEKSFRDSKRGSVIHAIQLLPIDPPVREVR